MTDGTPGIAEPHGSKPPTPAPGAQGSGGLLLLLICITGLGPLAMSSFVPAIPAIQEDFGASRFVSQLTLSVSLVFMAVGSLVYGTLADRLGRRPVILAGVSLAIFGSLLCLVATNVWLVILGRAVQATGSTVGFALSRVVVRDVYGEERSPSLLGYISAAMMIAPVLGPFIGGYLIEYASWRHIFGSIAVLATVLLLGLLAYLPESRPAGVTGDQKLIAWSRFGQLLSRRPYWRMVVYGSALQGTFMAFLGGAPYLITRVYGLPPSAYGYYFFGLPLGFLLGSLFAARFGHHFSQRGLMYWGAAGSVIACTIAVVLPAITAVGPWGVFAPLAVMMAAQACAYPALQVRLLTASTPHLGTGSGCFSALQLLSGGLITQVVGVTLYLGIVGVTGLMLLCSLIAMAIVLTRRPVQQDAPVEQDRTVP